MPPTLLESPFLDLDLPGRKVVVGGGPQAAELERRYPDVLFTGPKEGEDLANAYASADVFVFPSLTDTFGLVLLDLRPDDLRAVVESAVQQAHRLGGPGHRAPHAGRDFLPLERKLRRRLLCFAARWGDQR